MDDEQGGLLVFEAEALFWFSIPLSMSGIVGWIGAGLLIVQVFGVLVLHAQGGPIEKDDQVWVLAGKRIVEDSPEHRLAWNRQIEVPCIYSKGDFYYLFVNWGRCCRGIESTYEIRVGRSREITGPYLDRDGKDLVDAGGSLFPDQDGRFIGPGHVGVLVDDGRELFGYQY